MDTDRNIETVYGLFSNLIIRLPISIVCVVLLKGIDICRPYTNFELIVVYHNELKVKNILQSWIYRLLFQG